MRLQMLFVCSALAGAAWAQAPLVGNINLYGLHQLTAEQVLEVARVETGGALPHSKGDLEGAIGQLPGVIAVDVEAVCCVGNATDLFIGIAEQGSPQPSFHDYPSGSTTLPQEALDLYRQYVGAMQRAELKGTANEDLAKGQTINADPAVHAIQQKFIDYATARLPLLRDELKTGSVPEERAVAALIIGYAPRKLDVVGDLEYALDDPDAGVRASAVKSLAAIAVLAREQPGFGIRIAPTWFIEMLNSVYLSDRVEATKVLVTLTDSPNPAALDLLRAGALGSLTEMARWKTQSYAFPPFLLLGRAAGMRDTQIHQEWDKPDREAAIQTVEEAARTAKH